MPDPVKTPHRGGSYLPVLPDGWHWSVKATGPDGASVEIKNLHCEEHPWNVRVVSGEGKGTREATKPTLSDAAKTAVAAAKGLDRITKAEADAAKARASLLDGLGGEIEPDDNPDDEVDVSEAEVTAAPGDEPIAESKESVAEIR